jgi:hypothetical protein
MAYVCNKFIVRFDFFSKSKEADWNSVKKKTFPQRKKGLFFHLLFPTHSCKLYTVTQNEEVDGILERSRKGQTQTHTHHTK